MDGMCGEGGKGGMGEKACLSGTELIQAKVGC